MSLEEPLLDPLPIDPEVEPEPVEPECVESRSLVDLPEEVPLVPVDPDDVPLCARAGPVARRSPAIPRPPTTPHPIFIRIPSLLLVWRRTRRSCRGTRPVGFQNGSDAPRA